MGRILLILAGFAAIVVILAMALPPSYSQVLLKGSAGLALGFVALIYPYFAIRDRRNLKKAERDIRFNRTGLKLENVGKNSWLWRLPGRGWVRLTHNSFPPAWPADLSRLEELKSFYCQERGTWGGGSKAIVEFEPLEVRGCEVLRMITKETFNHYPLYAGRLIFPFQTMFYDISVFFPESRTSDLGQTRDYIVFRRTLDTREVAVENVDGIDVVHGWYRDRCREEENDLAPAPFLTKVSWPETVDQIVSRRSLADEELYDEEFPAHALTKVRSALKTIQDSLTVSERLASAPPFRTDTQRGAAVDGQPASRAVRG